MGVYIKGMEMPKDGEKLYMITFSDGKACASYKPFEWHEVVPVPPHGRLGDLDEFYADINESALLTDGFKETFNLWFDEQETIIPAEEEAK